MGVDLSQLTSFHSVRFAGGDHYHRQLGSRRRDGTPGCERRFEISAGRYRNMISATWDLIATKSP
jgi:hypothetical protein